VELLNVKLSVCTVNVRLYNLFSDILRTSQVPQFKVICIIFNFYESSPSTHTPDVMCKGDFFKNAISDYFNLHSLHDCAFVYGND